MKRLYLFFVICFISFFSFAEDYTRFSSSTHIKTVFNYFLENEWKFNYLKEYSAITFEPKNDVYYIGQKVASISFSFDSEGFIVHQHIVLADIDYPYSKQEAFRLLLQIACKDSASFYNYQYEETDDAITYNYYAHVPEYNNSLYSITSVNNNYCFISILYSDN